MIDIVLYAVVATILIYLIYRYHRYSVWEATNAGRAFMLMKVCLLVLVTYGLASVTIPGDWRDGVRRVIVLSIAAALSYQTYVIVQSQGGFRRKRQKSGEEPERRQP